MSQPTRPQMLAKALAAKPAAHVEIALRTIELGLGGREALVAALAYAPRDFAYVVGLIGDPRRAKTPLAQLAAEGGITPGELLDAYRAGEQNRAQALSIAKVGERLADVTADTMLQAIPHEVTCTACYGTGSITPEPTKKKPNPQPEPCGPCQGTGVLMKAGCLEHKKLALDLGRMLPKGGGINVAVQTNQNNFGSSVGGSLEALQMATDAILHGGADVPAPFMEAEVLDVGDQDPSGGSVDVGEAELDTDWRGDLP